ncbi:hypothetical protein Vadar_009350 [Vaccinium darrowii]|uniref:Uncharacterized protein n=1 Tax=Vaccinium darrowii TaxID=229202 RepID=A0ACB7X8S3_9ERIC|nr:hypothetical protein Vadar_009350 [Vaccinium darrowii]
MADVTKLSDVMKERVSNVESDLLHVKRAFLDRSDDFENHVNMKVPEQKSFGGARNAKELENFLWDMEQYFPATRVLEGEKVTITAMYLMGDAKLWWRTRSEDEVCQKIETWEMLKKELKEQFCPYNSSWIDLPSAVAATNGLADSKLTNKSNSSKSSSSKSKDKNKKKNEKKAGSKKREKGHKSKSVEDDK